MEKQKLNLKEFDEEVSKDNPKVSLQSSEEKLATTLVWKMKKQDEDISKLFSLIETKFESLDSSILNISVNSKQVISSEYILLKLRVKLMSELSSVKQLLLFQSKLTSPMRVLIRNRETYLLQQLQRINELREDINVLQKFQYSLNFQKS